MKIARNRFFLMMVAGTAALGIAVAATMSTAHAHGGFGGGGSADGTSYAARVAEKLNDALSLDEDITEAQVQTAFDGVVDRQDEGLEAKLDELEVDDETRTAITDWFDGYPYADLIRLRPIGMATSDNVTNYLERLVEKERVTQAQSDGIQSWYDGRPELPEGLERTRQGRHGRGGDGAGTSFRGRFHGGN